MDNLQDLLALDSLTELGWGMEIFAVVTATLIVRIIALRLLSVAEKHLQKTDNTWDDALFEAARGPLSWFILIMGLLWAVDISDGYVDVEMFSAENLDLARQLTFIFLTVVFFWRFISQGEKISAPEITTDRRSSLARAVSVVGSIRAASLSSLVAFSSLARPPP